MDAPFNSSKLKFSQRSGDFIQKEVSECYFQVRLARRLRRHFTSLQTGAKPQQPPCIPHKQQASWLCCVQANDEVVGIAILLFPRVASQIFKILIHCIEDNLYSDLFLDHLIDLSLRLASEKSVASMELEFIEGQRKIRKTCSSERI